MPTYEVDVPSGQDVRNAAHTVTAHTGIRKSQPEVAHASTAHYWEESPRTYDRNQPYYSAFRDQNGRKPGPCTVFWYRFVLFLCVFVFPPIAVFLQAGCSKTLVINILLTLLGLIPGIIHAVLIVCCTRSSLLEAV